MRAEAGRPFWIVRVCRSENTQGQLNQSNDFRDKELPQSAVSRTEMKTGYRRRGEILHMVLCIVSRRAELTETPVRKKTERLSPSAVLRTMSSPLL